MPRYEYRCEFCKRDRDEVYAMSEEIPREIRCECDAMMHRVYRAPAAIHFKGRGFYATDVKGTLHRKRRPNPGDDLHKEFDRDAAQIARHL